ASDANRIRPLPGVAAVVGDRSVYAPVVDRRGRLLRGDNGSPSVGHGWESAVLAPYLLTSGHAPTRRWDVVIDTQLASRGALRVGDRLQILIASGRATYTVSGIVGPAPSHDLPGQAAVFFRT